MSVSSIVLRPLDSTLRVTKSSAAVPIRMDFCNLRYGFGFWIGQDRLYFHMSGQIFFTFMQMPMSGESCNFMTF